LTGLGLLSCGDLHTDAAGQLLETGQTHRV